MAKFMRRLLPHDFVDVTPIPILAGLKGSDDRMAGLVKMFGRVLVLGRIAATHVTASAA